ncbi:MAG: hypothetical protein K2J80_14470, partial [Oscillospiraceae bacterium]|nr:hypothetical protein [Oscillospiraceae bacterium]
MELQEKNYTNPADRGRFGYSMSGEFYSPYKAETFLVTVLVGVAIAAGLALLFALGRLNDQNHREAESTTSVVLFGSVIALLIFIVILIIIFGVGVRAVKKGFRCHYSANDETFTANIGGDLHVIQYKDVTGINFHPRTFLGKIRGYDITIRVSGRDQTFSVCSDGYISPKSTPFFIIQERVDILRQSRSSSTTPINTSRADSRAITRAEVDRAQSGSISAMDRMAQLLGETSNMPELSATPSLSEQAAARVTQMMNQYSSDEMPTVGAPRRALDPGTFIDSDGREKSQYDVQAQGTFYVKPTGGALLLSLIFWIALVAGIIYLVLTFQFPNASNPRISFRKLVDYEELMMYLLIVAVAALPTSWIVFTKMHGTLYNYKADGRGFFVSVKGKGSEQLLYKDVLSVDYTLTKFLGC